MVALWWCTTQPGMCELDDTELAPGLAALINGVEAWTMCRSRNKVWETRRAVEYTRSFAGCPCFSSCSKPRLHRGDGGLWLACSFLFHRRGRPLAASQILFLKVMVAAYTSESVCDALINKSPTAHSSVCLGLSKGRLVQLAPRTRRCSQVHRQFFGVEHGVDDEVMHVGGWRSGNLELVEHKTTPLPGADKDHKGEADD